MLDALQQRVAALVTGLPEALRVRAGRRQRAGRPRGAGPPYPGPGLLRRSQRSPRGAPPRRRDRTSLRRRGLHTGREREPEEFVRLSVTDGSQDCEIDVAIDYRALDPVGTRYGRALDLRELGANKVLAIFDRAAPRDFLDLAELTMRFPLQQLITLAAAKNPVLTWTCSTTP